MSFDLDLAEVSLGEFKSAVLQSVYEQAKRSDPSQKQYVFSFAVDGYISNVLGYVQKTEAWLPRYVQWTTALGISKATTLKDPFGNPAILNIPCYVEISESMPRPGFVTGLTNIGFVKPRVKGTDEPRFVLTTAQASAAIGPAGQPPAAPVAPPVTTPATTTPASELAAFEEWKRQMAGN